MYKRILVTAALPYANGPLHIGHLAGAYISADIYVRFQRMMGKDILFVCGSDEHGAAITMRAANEGISPQAIVDKYHNLFVDTFKGIGISFDIFHRTSAELHHQTSQEFFSQLYESGEFEETVSEQYYDEEVGQFLADRYIVGTCPKCNHPEAYGDQCENCGSTLNPTDLIHPKSVNTGNTPILKETKHWYLPLNKYEDWLKTWINEGTIDGAFHHFPDQWKNHVIGQCNSWIDGGLQPRSMTRDLDWGIDVPQQIEGSKGKKLYVWMDAPIGYISATKQWAQDNQKDWKEYWQSEDTRLIHFIGKDNIVFHCIIFPAILKAVGKNYILPENVPANQFMNLEGKKISTSKNWAVWVHEYLQDFEGQEDALRYCMIKNMPEQKDSEFTWVGFQESNNNELVNNLANFINRVVVLTNKYYDGIVPDFDPDVHINDLEDEMELSFHDNEILRLFDDLDKISEYIRKFEFRAALKKIMEISSKGNQLLQANEPWKIQKEDPETVKNVMNIALQYVAALSHIIKPFLPFASDKIQDLLNLSHLNEHGELLSVMNLLAEGEVILAAGHKINKSNHLFSRIEDDKIKEQVQKLKNAEKVEASTSENNGQELLPISFEDFTKLDIRIGTIVSAEKVKKANKLLCLQVDIKDDQRTVVSGIAEHYDPAHIIGQQVILLTNLAPRKIMGIESQGMILMAEDGNGSLKFIQPSEAIINGAKVS